MLALKGKVVVNKNLPIGAIQIGFHNVGIVDYKYERSVWENSGTVEFKGRALFNSGSRISNSGYLLFGNNVLVTANSSIVCVKKITVGADTLISWDVLIMDTDFHKLFNSNGEQVNNPKEIIIGDHSWICCRSLILKGAMLPSDFVIAAGSIITSKLTDKSNCIVADAGRVIKEDVTWRN